MSNYIGYELAVHAVRVAALAVAPFNARVRSGVRGRRAATGRLEQWATAQRDPVRPLYWLHAPSVGEALMAQAIMERLRAASPGCQVAFTWFSPSAERIADRLGADVTAYLPWDLRGEVRRALDALDPDVIGFVRTEVWPVLMREARARGVPTALVNAPLAEGSSRLRPAARRFLASAYGRLDAVGAVSAPDAQRLEQLGAAADRIHVTGDARVDQVLDRLDRLDGAPTLVGPLREPDGSVIVAGSTWPADEALLLPALRTLRERRRGPVRLIIAPHEPSASHLDRLEAALTAAGMASVRMGAVESGAPVEDVVIVDRVGVLADLYRIADVAWVGGGFGNAGLHSVLEPAAAGVPVVYGPRFGNTVEAAAMVEAGCGFVAPDSASIADRFEALLGEGGQTGRLAREWVQARRGGAARNAELLLGLKRRARA